MTLAVTEAIRPCCGGKAHAPHKEGCTAPRKRSGPSGGQPRYRLPKELGEAAAPKGTTNTIESMRVKDETIITEVDDEIKGEQEIDEFASYFK